MIRAPIGKQIFWDVWVSRDIGWIRRATEFLHEPSKYYMYDPQFTHELSKDITRLILRRYSRGDPISELSQYFVDLLDTWEVSNRLSRQVCAGRHLDRCRDWTFELSNLNHYNWCFWLVSIALVLEVPTNHWQRLLVLIGGEGQDALLDCIIASRRPNRAVGNELLHPMPYARLLKAIHAPKDEQAALLSDFVAHWYSELAREGKDELWWYAYGDPVKNPLEIGSYFGRWCIEAVAAVKVFGLDDSLCLGHKHYPGDLLRTEGLGTHSVRTKPERSLIAKLLGMNKEYEP